MFDSWRRTLLGDAPAACTKTGAPPEESVDTVSASRSDAPEAAAAPPSAPPLAAAKPTASPLADDTTETAAGGLLADLAPSGWLSSAEVAPPPPPDVPTPDRVEGQSSEPAVPHLRPSPPANTEEPMPSWREIGAAAGFLAGGAIANAARSSVSQLRGVTDGPASPSSAITSTSKTNAFGTWSAFFAGGAAAAEATPRSRFRTWVFQSPELTGVLGLLACFAAWYAASEFSGRSLRRVADDPEQSPASTGYMKRVTLPFTPIGRDGSGELAAWGRRLGCAYATMQGTAWSFWYQQGYYSTDTTYVLPAATTLGLVRATHEVHSMCLETIDEVVSSATLMTRIGIPQHLHYHIWRSWQAREPDCLGRMDFALDERTGVPKFLEYNADTPTILLESGPLQLSWFDHFARGVRDWSVAPPDTTEVLQQSLAPYRHAPDACVRLADAAGITGAGDSRPRWGQLNSIQSNLRDACKRIIERRARNLQAVQLHFAFHPPDDVELANTVAFVRDAYINAGAAAPVKCAPVTSLDKIRLKEEPAVSPNAAAGTATTTVMVDTDDQPITTLVKWYPWEAFSEEECGTAWYLKHRGEKTPYDALDGAAKTATDPLVIEPAWKYVLTSKALLPLLWERYPGHPNLVEAHTSMERLPDAVGTDWVAKPAFGREGAGVVRSGRTSWNPLIKTTEREGFVVAALNGGDKALGALVYQRFVPTAVLAGRQAVFGSWVINGQPSGFAIREDRAGVFTNNNSCFVPHVVDMEHATAAFTDALDTLPFRRLAAQLRKGFYGGNGGLQVSLTPARTDGKVDDVVQSHRRGSGGIRCWGTGGGGGFGSSGGTNSSTGRHAEEKPAGRTQGARRANAATPAKPYGGSQPKALSKPTGSWTSRMQARVSS